MKKLLFAFIVLSVTSTFSFGQNTLVSSGQIFEGEPYLVLSPQNPQHLVAAWMGFQFNQKIVIKSAFSEDGGLTWSTPIWQAHQQSGNSSADVSMAYDTQGNLYMAYIDYDNLNFSNGAVICRKSANGGISWGPAVVARAIGSCPNKLCIDRPWIAVDPLTGSVVITSISANQPTLVQAPYHPYMAISSDQGQSFSLSELDAAPYLAGNSIQQPLASPAFYNNGTFMALYPSYDPSQSVLPRIVEVTKTAPASFYSYAVAFQGLGFGSQNDSLKKGPHLSINPTNSNEAAYTFMTEVFGDPDIALIEKINGQWSAPMRVNNDAQANGVLQDLAWSAYDTDGELAVCWRDRRNGTPNTYSSPTEIACRIRSQGNWSEEIFISPLIAHDSILLENGNDFLNVQFYQNKLYTIWGDVRSGSLKIYLNVYDQNDSTNSVSLIADEGQVFPNPSSSHITVNKAFIGRAYTLIDQQGRLMLSGYISEDRNIALEKLAKGTYVLKIGTWSETILKN
jgi:hypothetical protein